MKKKTGSKGALELKIDLEKAYNCIEWDFLRYVLEEIGYSPQLTKLVIFSVSSANLSLIWNGERINPFSPKRGFRKGDLLSPYLYVLCMEILSHKIKRATTQGQ